MNPTIPALHRRPPRSTADNADPASAQSPFALFDAIAALGPLTVHELAAIAETTRAAAFAWAVGRVRAGQLVADRPTGRFALAPSLRTAAADARGASSFDALHRAVAGRRQAG